MYSEKKFGTWDLNEAGKQQIRGLLNEQKWQRKV